MKKKIVLLGYMGSGKSAVGKQLAEHTNALFIDLDAYIEDKEHKIIADIFAEKGEIYFRKLESKYLKQVLETEENIVLSLGGGTPCFAGNMDVVNLSKNTVSLYLQTSIATLTDRLFAERKKRPLISHLDTKATLTEFIGKHLFERLSYYSLANHTISTDNKSIISIVDEIKDVLII